MTGAQSLSPFPGTQRENHPARLVSEHVSTRFLRPAAVPVSAAPWWHLRASAAGGRPPSSAPRPPHRHQTWCPRFRGKGRGPLPPLEPWVPAQAALVSPGTFREKAQLCRVRVNMRVCSTTDPLSPSVGSERPDTATLPRSADPLPSSIGHGGRSLPSLGVLGVGVGGCLKQVQEFS